MKTWKITVLLVIWALMAVALIYAYMILSLPPTSTPTTPPLEPHMHP